MIGQSLQVVMLQMMMLFELRCQNLSLSRRDTALVYIEGTVETESYIANIEEEDMNEKQQRLEAAALRSSMC